MRNGPYATTDGDRYGVFFVPSPVGRRLMVMADDGAEILKLWLHLPKRAQRKRLERLEEHGRLAPDDWKHGHVPGTSQSPSPLNPARRMTISRLGCARPVSRKLR